MTLKNRCLLALAALILPVALLAQEPAEPAPFDPVAFEKSLHFLTGTIRLPGGKAVLNLSEKFRYLPPADTRRLLQEGWGNPVRKEFLGMIVPADVSPVSPGGWGVIVDYENDGHVSDSDAAKIDYDELLAEMRKGVDESNTERRKAGYETVELLGWASKPFYDEESKRLYWAKELKFEGQEGNTLNYNIRVLGREGVLTLNAVAGMDQFKAIAPDLNELVAVARFTDGHRYADYDALTDRKAEYGLAAMVAGGVAAKAGWLTPILLAFKKLFVLILLGLGWLGKKLLSMLGKNAE